MQEAPQLVNSFRFQLAVHLENKIEALPSPTMSCAKKKVS